MTDKILAALWMLTLVVFVGILLVYVNEIALWVVAVICLLFGVYDFFDSTRTRKDETPNP